MPRRCFLPLCVVAALLAAPALADDFTVAALNDIHVTDSSKTALLDEAIKVINGSNARLTLVLGDLSATGSQEQLELAKQSLDRLKMPYAVIPGNHDCPTNRPLPFAKTFRDSHWVRHEGNWCFIGLNSCDGPASTVSIRPKEIAWLKAQLQSIAADKPIALFVHHPFNPHAKRYRVKNADKVLALFAGHKLKLVAAGHWHGNQEETRGGVLFVTTACCTMTRDNFDKSPDKGFRLFSFQGEAVASRFVPVKVPGW